ncbi:hypothetical protein D9M72_502920 [compost metagenome]
MPMAVPCRWGEKSRLMISGTAMLPMVMATPMIAVPNSTRPPFPAERTITPASTPRSVSMMANSAPNFRPANDASGAASEKHSTGIPVSSPSSTGENPRSCCIGPTTGATATNGPRMFSAMSPMLASRIQPRGILARMFAVMRRAAAWCGSWKSVSSSHCYHARGNMTGVTRLPAGWLLSRQETAHVA